MARVVIMADAETRFAQIGASETDLDAYAVRHVEGPVDGWKALDSKIHRR
jgi:hypothetical protein